MNQVIAHLKVIKSKTLTCITVIYIVSTSNIKLNYLDSCGKNFHKSKNDTLENDKLRR